MTRSILQPLKTALECAETVAAGDLTRQITPTGRDEAAELLEALSGMQMMLLSTLRQIGGTSSKLASAAEELNAVTLEGGREAHRQQLEIEQAAAAITEMTVAIDAARAGDAGRGFAVVADEVRALAHRSSESTREIEEMIRAIQACSENAVASMQSSRSKTHAVLGKARLANSALEEIVESSSAISRQNRQITTATVDQASVARSVDMNISTIRDVSVQSVEGAKQLMTASHELAQLATELQHLLGQFHTR